MRKEKRDRQPGRQAGRQIGIEADVDAHRERNTYTKTVMHTRFILLMRQTITFHVDQTHSYMTKSEPFK